MFEMTIQEGRLQQYFHCCFLLQYSFLHISYVVLPDSVQPLSQFRYWL